MRAGVYPTLLAVSAALASLAAQAQGRVPTAPQITEVTPPVAERGSTVEVTLRGSRLAGCKSLLCRYSPNPALIPPVERGLQAQVLDAAEGQVRARVTIPADAPLGLHEIRSWGAYGLTNSQYLFVTPYPVVAEKEPNNAISQAQDLTVPVTVSGVVGNDGDEDTYSFAAKAGERLTISVDGFKRFEPAQRPGNGLVYLDAFLQLRDARGHELACDDDSDGLDAQLSYQFPADGTYYATVRDAEHRGRGDFRYALTLGRQPVVIAVYPPVVQRGQRQVATVYGFNLFPSGETETKTFITPDSSAPVFEFRHASQTGISNPVLLLTSPYPVITEEEPNDRVQDGTPVVTPCVCAGKFDRPDDVDAFRFQGQAGQRLVFDVMAQRLGSPVDTYLTLQTRSGQVIARDDDGSGGPDSRLEATLPNSDEYVVFLRNNLKNGNGPRCSYALTIRALQPTFTIGLEQAGTKIDGQPGQVPVDNVTVPQGGSTKFQVVLKRVEGQKGDVAVRLSAVPEIPGLSVKVDPIKNGSNSTTVELTAAPNAPLGNYASVFLICKGMAGNQPYEPSRKLWLTVAPPN